jgi:hypothetical protein
VKENVMHHDNPKTIVFTGLFFRYHGITFIGDWTTIQGTIEYTHGINGFDGFNQSLFC